MLKWQHNAICRTPLDTELKENPKKYFKRFWTKIKIINAETQAYVASERKPGAKPSRSRLLLNADLMQNNFSPIYDSGCCLGREMMDEQIKIYLNEPLKVEKYLRKGVSEIHWKGFPKKKNHFELIELIREEFKEEVDEALSKIKSNFNVEKVTILVSKIDRNLPDFLKDHKLSGDRKELMIKLITLRAERLMQL